MEIKNVGLINDINAENFLADGSVYINKVVEEKSEPINLVSKQLSAMSFENMTSKIINNATNITEFKTEDYFSSELLEYFANNRDKILDVIIFPETGVQGINKVSLKDTSIVYFSLYGNIKIGFFINKTIANIVFGGDIKND